MLTNILVLLAIGGLFYFMMRRGGGGCCGGHGSHDDHGTPEAGHEHQHHMEQEAATVPDKDPVCSMTVDPGGPETEYNGRVYHFCSDRCLNLFQQQPEKYA